MSGEERPALIAHFQDDGVLHKWDCAESGHLFEHSSNACLQCGHVDQMTFDEVTEYELQPGDPDYTTWVAGGRKRLSWDEYDALRGTGRNPRTTPIEDVLPGL